MLDFRTRNGTSPAFFDIVATPSDQDQFDIVLRIFRRDERTASEKIATVGWRDIGYVLSSCRVTLERLGYWEVEAHDFGEASYVERAAA